MSGLPVAILLAVATTYVSDDASEPAPRRTPLFASSGTIQPKPRLRETEVPERFRLACDPFEYEACERICGNGLRRFDVRLPSPIESDYPENNTVYGELFLPENKPKCPCVIVLHIAGGDFDLSRLQASMFANNGVAAMFVKLPYYGERKPKTARVRISNLDGKLMEQSARQAIGDLRRVCDWIEAQGCFEEGKIGIFGVSLGAMVGALAASMEERITHGVLVMGGARFEKIAYGSTERDAERFRVAWKAIGGTEELLRQIVAPFDPANHHERLSKRTLYMIAAKYDRTVPPECCKALWEAGGKQRIDWIPAGHYSMALYFGPLMSRAIGFFQEWPTREENVAAQTANAGTPKGR